MERPVCGGTTGDLRMKTRLTGRRRCTGCLPSIRDRGPGTMACANRASVHPKMGFLPIPWWPASSHRVQSSTGPSGDPSWPLPEGGDRAVSPSRPGPGRTVGFVHRPTADSLPVAVSRSSVRSTVGAGDHPRRSSEEVRRGARPDGAWLLVASFHTRFVPSTPFLTTWTGCPSPGLSGMFHPVTLVGFGFRWNDLPKGSRSVRPEGRPGRSIPLNLPCAAGPKATVVTLRPTRPWQARDATRVRSRRSSLRGPGPLPNAFAPDQVKTRPRLTRPEFPPGSRGGTPSRGRSSGARTPSRVDCDKLPAGSPPRRRFPMTVVEDRPAWVRASPRDNTQLRRGLTDSTSHRETGGGHRTPSTRWLRGAHDPANPDDRLVVVHSAW